MDAKIVEFTALLRANGLRVSMSEHLDAFRAVATLGVGHRPSFKEPLGARGAMVKRAIDLPVYDELFDLYFSGLGQAVRQGAATLMENMQLDAEQFQQLMAS